MTDPVVRSSALTVSITASSSLACTMPAGFVAGDLLIAVYLQRGNTAAMDDPAGWTRIGSHASGAQRSCDVFGKVAAGGETLTIGKPTTDTAAACVLAIQTGTFDTVQWAEGFTTLMALSSDSTPPLPDSTTTVDGALAISAGGIRSASTTGSGLTAPGTWTSRGSGFADNNSDGMSVGCCSKTITTAGSTGTYDWTSPQANSGPMVTFVVRPSGASSPPANSATVYAWKAASSDYVLVASVADWRAADSDYKPPTGSDEVRGWDAGVGQYIPGGATDTEPPSQPGTPTPSAIGSTTITWGWAASTDTVGVTGYRIRLNGGSWVNVATNTYPATGLTPSTAYTPEVQARDAAGNWSTIATGSATSTTATADVTPPTQPGQPTATPTGGNVALTWTTSTDAVGVTAYDVHRSATSGFTPSAGTLKASPATNSYTELNVPNGVWYYKIVARDAAGNTSTASTQRSVTVSAAAVMLMGCSSSPNSHGGTEVWDGWRVYDRSEMYGLANRTGSQKPKFLAYSEQGGSLTGTYASQLAHWVAEFDAFDYGNAAGTLGTGQQPSQTQSARFSIDLYVSNGNENYETGNNKALDQTVAEYTTSQRALYDAAHLIDSTTGLRRYPNIHAGSNPTQNQEQSGNVAAYLHPTAQYHDFVMWSMYPPGRQNTNTDPTYNWPSFVESDRTNLTKGFLIRCFYRTKQAEAQARIDTGDPNFTLSIGCGEVGIASDPGDNTTRPYYVVHGLAGAMFILADQYDLPMPFACWWDNTKAGGGPHNILTDEPPNSDHGGTGTTNPTTVQAWQNWPSYDHRRGGVHPSAWIGNPKPGWKQSGTPV